MNSMSAKSPHRRDDRDEPFVDALERHQELDSDEDLEAALHQELIEISGCSHPLGPEFDKAGEQTKLLR
jgi:hypothetical protein